MNDRLRLENLPIYRYILTSHLKLVSFQNLVVTSNRL